MRSRRCCNVEPVQACSPCDIPLTDLVLSLTYYKCIAGTATLTALDPIPLVLIEKPFAGSASRNGTPEGINFARYWRAGCVTLVDHTNSGPSCIPVTSRYNFIFGCNAVSGGGSAARLVAKSFPTHIYTEAQCIAGINESGASDTFIDTSVTFTTPHVSANCSPLDISYNLTTSTAPWPITGTVTE